MEINCHIFIQAPAEKVYAVAVTYPLFVDDFFKKEILFSNESESHVRVANKFFFIPLTWEGLGKKNKHELKIDWKQTNGLFKQMTAHWIIEAQTNNSAKASIRGVLDSKANSGIRILAKFLIPRTMSRILKALKKHSE